MRNDSLYGNAVKKTNVIKKTPFILTKPENDFSWPLFKIRNDPLIK